LSRAREVFSVRQDEETDPCFLSLNRFENREKKKAPDQRVGGSGLSRTREVFSVRKDEDTWFEIP